MIIGISGYARSGKDSLGKYLMNDQGFHRYAFADPLKEAARIIFGFTDEQLYGDLKEVVDPYWGFTPRWALQKLGTEGGREIFGNDLWVKATMRKILPFSPFSKNYVVTDVRFRNEAEIIHATGGIVVRIVRDDAKAKGGVEGHASEDLSDVPYDMIIPNNGDKEDLKGYAQSLANTCRTAYYMLVSLGGNRPSTLKLSTGYFETLDADYLNDVARTSQTILDTYKDKVFDDDMAIEVERPYN